MNSIPQYITGKFWGRVDKEKSTIFYNGSRCWEWTDARKSGGYGNLWWNRKPEAAHRVAWILTHGEIPGGLFVLHHCDNPPCVNPAHLFLGTLQENVADMVKKGRHYLNRRRGESNHKHKLTAKQVAEIREQHNASAKKTGTAPLARKYGVAISTIKRIVNGKLWK